MSQEVSREWATEKRVEGPILSIPVNDANGSLKLSILLIGSLGLALVLAAVMYFTRNIDWYGMGGRSEE